MSAEGAKRPMLFFIDPNLSTSRPPCPTCSDMNLENGDGIEFSSSSSSTTPEPQSRRRSNSPVRDTFPALEHADSQTPLTTDPPRDNTVIRLESLQCAERQRIVFERELRHLDTGATSAVIVPTDHDLVTTNDPNAPKYCVLGSRDHCDALEKQKQEVQVALVEGVDRQRHEARVIKQLQDRLLQLEEQIKVLSGSSSSNQSTAAVDVVLTKEAFSPTATTVDVNHENKPLKAHLENEQGHDDQPHFQLFGHMKKYEIIEHPRVEGLFQMPRIRQYFIDDVLYRDRHERKVTWDELFFDLIFVSVVSKLGHLLRSTLTFTLMNQYLLLFFPVWLVWWNTVGHINRFASEDMLQKLFLLVIGALAIGMELNVDHAFSSDPATCTANVFIGSFLICRLVFAILLFLHILNHHQFFYSLSFHLFCTSASVIPYFVSMFVGAEYREALWWTGFALEQVLFFGSMIIFRLLNIRFQFRVALNIEHYSERIGLFSLIVLGEIVVAASALASQSSNPTMLYFGSFIGLLIATSIQWIYFHVDGSRHYRHALRRHTVTGVLFTFFHIPFHAAIVAAGAGIAVMLQKIQQQYDQVAVKTQSVHSHSHHSVSSFASSDSSSVTSLADRILLLFMTGLALFFLCLIGLMHEDRNQVHGVVTRLPKSVRLTGRAVVSGLCMLLTFVLPDVSPLVLLCITAALLVVQVFVEEVGRLAVSETHLIPRRRRASSWLWSRRHV